MAVASSGVVSAVDADAAALVTRQLVDLHVETASACVQIAVAR